MTPTPEGPSSALDKAKHRLDAALKANTFATWKDQTDRDRAAVKGVDAAKDATR